MKIIAEPVKPDTHQEACRCFPEVAIKAKPQGGAARLRVSSQKIVNPQEQTFLRFQFFLPFIKMGGFRSQFISPVI